MELRQLEYFVAVAEEANFTRAAERVHISQSGVSAQIRQLEREVGADLIDRSGRVATLTTAGTAALGPARAALAAVGAVRAAVDDVVDLVRGRLVVGMVTACTVTPLFDALAAFHSDYPGVEIELVEDTSDRLVDAVRDGAMDLALAATAGAPPDGLSALAVLSEGLAAAVPPGHPLAGRESVRLSEVTSHPIVCLPVGTGVRTVLDLACARSGLQPRIALQCSAPDAVADLAARSLGVAVLSESMAGAYPDRLSAIPISDVGIPAVLALIWTSSESPALRELLVRARSAFVG
jgi:DNA-binding transcriptional LysR family regulator